MKFMAQFAKLGLIAKLHEIESHDIWRPPSLSESTPIESKMELTYLGSEAYIFFHL